MKRKTPADNDLVDQRITGKKPKKLHSGPNNSSLVTEDDPIRTEKFQPSASCFTIDEEKIISSNSLNPVNHRINNSGTAQILKEYTNLKEKPPILDATPTKALLCDEKTQTFPSIENPSAKRLFSTPIKAKRNEEACDGSKIKKNVNRSARRKSTRALIERTFLANNSESEEDQEYFAEQICNSDDNGQGEGIPSNLKEPTVKHSKEKGKSWLKTRGRDPIPCFDLTAHENYFYQNKAGRTTTSNNTLSSLELLNHEEYFSRSRQLRDEYNDDLETLELLHMRQFNQWQFELSQNFNLCLYGFGSKKALLLQFANYLYSAQRSQENSHILVVNGYMKNLGIRDILQTVASAITNDLLKLSPPINMLETLFDLLAQNKSCDITLIVHSVDSHSLRRSANQYILGRLSSHPQVHLIASADRLSFPLLWDSSLRFMYNFLFHDCTTFQAYSSEIDVIEEVHELFGRSGRRVGGREGVTYVLKSLPENANKLFRVLIEEQLAVMDDTGADSDDILDGNDNQVANSKKTENGIGYHVLYQKAVEEFICSNEMNFRTLLKEFYDHQIIQSKKDSLGTEILSVPFRKEELEELLDDIK